jgi:hypothetical protein
MGLIRDIVALASLEHSSLRSSCPKHAHALIYRRILTIYTPNYDKLNGCSNAKSYFFLVILIEVFILKTTVNPKYTLTQKK